MGQGPGRLANVSLAWLTFDSNSPLLPLLGKTTGFSFVLIYLFS